MKQRSFKQNINWKREFALAPGYLICAMWFIFTFMLVGWIFVASFSTTKEILSGQLFAFESGLNFINYYNAWTTQNVSLFFFNSVIYTAVSCTLIVVIAAPAAYVLSRFQFRLNGLFQSFFAMALGIPVIMVIMPLFSVVSFLDLTNSRGLMIFLYTGMGVPFTIVFLLAFFKNLSFTFEEAAAIDGSTPMNTFWKIMLPLAQPGIVTVSIFNFINVWNEFFMSTIFANKQNVRPIAVGLYNIVKGMQYTNDYGGLFAAVVIVFMPTFVLYIFLSEKIIAGVTGGAIKG